MMRSCELTCELNIAKIKCELTCELNIVKVYSFRLVEYLY